MNQEIIELIEEDLKKAEIKGSRKTDEAAMARGNMSKM